MKMNRATVKFITVSIGNAGAGFVVGTAIKSLVPVDSKVNFALRFVGTWVIGGLISEHTGAYIGRKFDDVADALTDAIPSKEEV